MRNILKKKVNDDSVQHKFNPKVGIPAIVDGALNQNDIMRLQKIKQDLFPESLAKQRKQIEKMKSVKSLSKKSPKREHS